MDNNSVKNRIQKLMESEQLTPASFAKVIEVNPSAISHILNDRNKPSLDILTKILNNFRLLNSEWLIMGSGEMYKSDKQSDKPVYTSTLFDSETAQSDSQPSQVAEKTYPYYKTTTHVIDEDDEPAEYKRITPPVVEKEIIKEVMVKAPEKKIQRIIVYYTDNTFEEFLTHPKP